MSQELSFEIVFKDKLHLGLNSNALSKVQNKQELILSVNKLGVLYTTIYRDTLFNFVETHKIKKIILDKNVDPAVAEQVIKNQPMYLYQVIHDQQDFQNEQHRQYHSLANQIFNQSKSLISQTAFNKVIAQIYSQFVQDHWLLCDSLRWFPVFLKQESINTEIVQLAQYEWIKFIVTNYDFGKAQGGALNPSFNLVQLKQKYIGLFLNQKQQMCEIELIAEHLKVIELLYEGVVIAPTDLKQTWRQLQDLNIILP